MTAAYRRSSLGAREPDPDKGRDKCSAATAVIDPNHPLKKLWDTLTLLATIFAAIEVPLRLVYRYPLEGGMAYTSYALYAIFGLDVVLHFITARIGPEGELVWSRANSARAYLRGWFWIDLTAAIPFTLFFDNWVAHVTDAARIVRLLQVDGPRLYLLLQLIKFLKVHRFVQVLRGWGSSEVLNPGVLRLLFFTFWISLGVHWFACVWIYLGAGIQNVAPQQQFLVALYYVVTTVTTIGFGDISPEKTQPLQVIFTMFMQIFGAGMYGYLIGNLASIIASIDIAKTHHLEKMERVSAFMRFREIPPELQGRIRQYYNYLWEKRRGYDESVVLADLPHSLMIDVALHLNREIIEKVPLFQGASPSMIRALVQRLKPVVYMPGDWIFDTGDIGNEMYFISKGSVEVLSPDGQTVFATLVDGQFFGEIALLLSMPRTAGVRARTFCELYQLGKSDFEEVIRGYPEFAASVREEAERRRSAIRS